ncbi:SitI3 family protein [Corallococcus sp. CA053C]|uniref:SitI3 family protein n=1 Tax=Corallococcus sp. CA053C TaxID=2316732 RepID=UPI0011C48D6D|nr:SitI3 family protein [Corallococcus sp. CA053C]
MGLDYSLSVSTDLTPAAALKLLAEQGPLPWEDATHLGAPGWTVGVSIPGARSRALWHEAFHFHPDLSVGFRYASNHDFSAFTRLLLRAALILKPHCREGVLLFNGEHIVLRWSGDPLVFNQDCWPWDDDAWLQAEVGRPVERRSLPSPLL